MRYVNVCTHAIDTPSGAVVAPLGFVELDDADAEALVAAGLVQAAPDPAATPTKSKKGSSS